MLFRFRSYAKSMKGEMVKDVLNKVAEIGDEDFSRVEVEKIMSGEDVAWDILRGNMYVSILDVQLMIGLCRCSPVLAELSTLSQKYQIKVNEYIKRFDKKKERENHSELWEFIKENKRELREDYSVDIDKIFMILILSEITSVKSLSRTDLRELEDLLGNEVGETVLNIASKKLKKKKKNKKKKKKK